MMTQPILERAIILVAEDDPSDVMLFERAARKAGIKNRIYYACDGGETIAYLSGDGAFSDREKFPLPMFLFLDLRMPRKSGYDVLQWMGHQPHLDGLMTAVVTSIRDLPYVERAYELGAKAYLVKPVVSLDLMELLQRFQGCLLHELGGAKQPARA